MNNPLRFNAKISLYYLEVFSQELTEISQGGLHGEVEGVEKCTSQT